MKNSTLFRVFVALLLFFTATSIRAYDFEDGGIYYSINEDDTSVSVTSGDNLYSGEVNIPATVSYAGNTYSVTAISGSAFYKCIDLTSVFTGKSVTTIGRYAFGSCTGLTDLTISDSVTLIDESAFYNCKSLTSVILGNTVTIGKSAFSGCSSLLSVEFGYSVASIGNYAFDDCSALTFVRIPESAISVSGNAFRGCSLESITVDIDNPVYDSRNECNAIIEKASNTLITGCKNTVIPNSVTAIGEEAFSECTGLTSIDIPESVTSIGSYAFYYSGLTSTVIPETVTYIGVNCISGTPFYSNQPDGLLYFGKVLYKYKGTMPENTSIQIKGGTVHIADYAIAFRNEMTSLEIPNTVKSIGFSAFEFCDGLKSLNIPGSVTSMEDNPFAGCKFDNITVESSNPVYDSRNGCNAIIETVSNTLVTGCKNTKILSSVTSIGNSAFKACDDLTSLTIPNSVKTIDFSAFFGCFGLTVVAIPNSVTTIGERAFSECINLKSVTIGDGVSEIPNSCFLNDELLENVIIGSGVKKIIDRAFRYCSAITSITMKATTPPACVLANGNEADVFASVNKENVTLYVPDGCEEAYSGAFCWKDFMNIAGKENIRIDEKVGVIVDGRTLHFSGVSGDVYNLNGMKLYSGRDNVELAPGVYIIVSDGSATKVVLK
ncbi:MAG: leucine-rich repeat domain-containing protein [Muribaculaceae bacterium]